MAALFLKKTLYLSFGMTMKRLNLLLVTLMLTCFSASAQFLDASSGLLQMPTAKMERDGTFMITNSYLNEHSLPSSGWGYDTFSYGFNVTFWSRMEVGYVCVIFDGKRRPNPSDRDLIMFNQDRHFTGKLQLLKEGDFGLDWLPSIAVGVSDPTTASSTNGYIDGAVAGTGNGFFNRWFAVASKDFQTPWGRVGAHLAYQYNQRSDYAINGPAAGVDWSPVWLQNRWLLDEVRLIAEYDSRTFNTGIIASVWDNRFELMFELQNMKWINFGARFKVLLLRDREKRLW